MADQGVSTDGHQSGSTDAVSAAAREARETAADVLAEGLWILLGQGVIGDRNLVTPETVTS